MAYQSKSFEDIEEALRKDLRKISLYFGKRRLKPNVSKTVSCLFHLNNQQASRQLKLRMNGCRIKHEKWPRYLGVILDRSLTYCPHLTDAEKWLKPRINLVQKLAGSNWGCSGKTLRITTHAMVLSVASYCAHVGMNSCHTKKSRHTNQLYFANHMRCGTINRTGMVVHPQQHHPFSNIARGSRHKRMSENCYRP